MENTARQLAILNLTGELPKELADYFAKKGIKAVDPLTDNTKAEWTHIITRDIHDFTLLRQTYKTLEKEIKIISLSGVADIQNFINANGKLIFDELWMKGPLGEFILDKFFQEYAGIALGDNYPKFIERGAFNIVNPFNTGEYLDRMVHAAFEHGVAALSVKTFFDHLNMYLSGLKNKGKAGFPFEVSYGVYDEVFGLQLHFYTQELMLEDVTVSLNNHISRRPEEHLLNVAVQSADFFDFTYLAQVKKVVVTALWTKDEKLQMENRGLMFASLSSAATLTGFQSEGLTSSLTQNGEIPDSSGKVVLPEVADESGEIKIKGESFTEIIAEKISSSTELDKIRQIVNGELDEDQFSQVISGSFETEDGKVVLSSNEELKDILNLVKGKVEEEKDIIKVSGGKLDADNFAMRIASGIADKAQGDGMMKVKSLGEKLPQSIKTGLFDFAKKLNKDIEALTATDLDSFQNFEVPEIIKSHTMVASNDTKGLLKDLRARLEQGLKEEFNGNSVEAIISGIKSPDDELRVKELLKDSLKVSLDNNFHLSQKESISKEEQDMLVKSLSATFTESEDKVRELVVGEASLDLSVPLFVAGPSHREKELEAQMEKMNQENSQLKNNLKTLLTEVKILKETKMRMAELQLKAKEAAKEAAKTESNIADTDEKLRALFQEKLAKQEALTQQDQKKLAELLEREKQLLATAKDEEAKAKKIQIEANQKEAMLMQEVEKSVRLIKAKDLMLAKTKEALTKTTEDKKFEVNELKSKLDQLTRSIASAPNQAQAQQIKDLEKQNQSLGKMLEVYKIKVQNIASNMQTKSDDGNSKEEVRKLNMQVTQFKNQLEMAKREVTKLQDRLSNDNGVINSLGQEKVKLENLLKKATSEANQKEQSTGNTELENNLKKAQAQNQALEVQLRETTTKLKDLELKHAELQKGQKTQGAGQDENSKGKLAQLENNVKKLTHDLIESRNQTADMKKEVNKLRQEKTALQNQLEKMKKENEKNKPAAGKKAS